MLAESTRKKLFAALDCWTPPLGVGMKFQLGAIGGGFKASGEGEHKPLIRFVQ